jgi:hypothetical protein
VTCRAYWGKSSLNDLKKLFAKPQNHSSQSISSEYRYSPEELHAMVDLKLEKKDED